MKDYDYIREKLHTVFGFNPWQAGDLMDKWEWTLEDVEDWEAFLDMVSADSDIKKPQGYVYSIMLEHRHPDKCSSKQWNSRRKKKPGRVKNKEMSRREKLFSDLLILARKGARITSESSGITYILCDQCLLITEEEALRHPEVEGRSAMVYSSMPDSKLERVLSNVVFGSNISSNGGGERQIPWVEYVDEVLVGNVPDMTMERISKFHGRHMKFRSDSGFKFGPGRIVDVGGEEVT